jgi:N-acetylglucosamine-6-phosphate deacetylase
MSMNKQAFRGADIFDGSIWHKNAALLISNATISAIVQADDIPSDYHIVELSGGILTAGFVDLQVNGGGGVQLNTTQTIDALRGICDAHAEFGTTALLPTLITDTPRITDKTAQVAKQAMQEKVAGMIGLHLEGPHLSVARKGAHDAALIRKMTDQDCANLVALAHELPSLLLTVAPENVTNNQIKMLQNAGAVISLGHTDAKYETIKTATKAGASSVTHLFNAMSQFTGRAPGVVGAALDTPDLSGGLIADGIHVSIESIKIALAAKQDPGKIYLVTDAMATIGTDLTEIRLDGRRILRQNSRLTLEDGTLAGADLDMISAVRFMVQQVGVDLQEVLRMASLYPAQLLGQSHEFGQLVKVARASFVHLSKDISIEKVWRDGLKLYS